jgi:hypothetical protein
MKSSSKARRPTTFFEQTVLSAYIHRFFEADERSRERARVVREVILALDGTDRRWTGRAVRLWFTNNRSRFGDTHARSTAPPLYPLPPPVLVPWTYFAIPMGSVPVDMSWPTMGAVFPAPVPMQPGIMETDRTNREEVRTRHFPPPELPPDMWPPR